jgi:hypothetical protein
MNGEIAVYLLSLLEHSMECHCEDCPSCRTLNDIFDTVKTKLFFSAVYGHIAAASMRAH